ncbi:MULTISPECIES: lipoyl(octanoyl) transferase LipB [Telluria group]|uniref:Octanoyltransferase n=1 Tax=Rugamonas rivuli TaxID=2743358 RepID=A0A843SDN8_9BURK|nr:MULTISPECIES: lipoyl(octanoyl) transferase LipB [Telluria group]MQA22665.1 lipoyl(octanoyl) transferase LipB [Rugamonas rivuli]OEZ61340.1 octanoyltransferase [Duganella sp. HH105]OFA05661.1 octanoyltransferase [Duganella sp. HH101]
MTFPTPSEPALIRHLGRADYDSTFAAMRAFTDARTPDTRDELWIVEHPPVFTLGLGADRGHLLAGASAIPVVQTDRGGEVTYHGPGQVVIYMLMDLRRNKPGGKLYARQFVHKIEQAIINVLGAYNLAGERVEGAPGIYMAGGPKQGAKIAALGLKVRGNGCTYHGLSLNVAMDLAPFSWINPCGYAGLETVDMRTVGATAQLSDVQQQLAEELIRVLAHVAEPAVHE